MAKKNDIVDIGFDYQKQLQEACDTIEEKINNLELSPNLSESVKEACKEAKQSLDELKSETAKAFKDISKEKLDTEKFTAFKIAVNKQLDEVTKSIEILSLSLESLGESITGVGKDTNLAPSIQQFKNLKTSITETNTAVEELAKSASNLGADIQIKVPKNDIKEVEQSVSQIQKSLKVLTGENKLTEYGNKKTEVLQQDLSELVATFNTAQTEYNNVIAEMQSVDDVGSDSFRDLTIRETELNTKLLETAKRIQEIKDVISRRGIDEYEKWTGLDRFDKVTDNDLDFDYLISSIVPDDLDDKIEDLLVNKVEIGIKNAQKVISSMYESFNIETSKKNKEKVSTSSNTVNNVTNNISGNKIGIQVDISTKNSTLWKKLQATIQDLQEKMSSNPIVAPVKLVLSPIATKTKDGKDPFSTSTNYIKEVVKKLNESSEDVYVDIDGVTKNTYKQALAEAEKQAKACINEIQDIFENTPIQIHLEVPEEELEKIANSVLTEDGKTKIDLTGQVKKTQQAVKELLENLNEVKESVDKTNEATQKATNSVSLDELSSEIGTIINQLQKVESIVAKGFGLSSITEIEQQWEAVEKVIEKSVRANGDFCKGANANKIVAEYQKYLDMGGTNDISSIDRLKKNKDTLTAIASQIKEASNIEIKVKDEQVQNLPTELSSVINKFEELYQNVSLTIDAIDGLLLEISSFKDVNTKNISQGIENVGTQAEQSKTSVEAIEKQWSDLQKYIKYISDENGGINLNKQRKEVQLLIEEYQKYVKMGGENPLSNLSNNEQTVAKLEKRYAKLNEEQSTDNSTSIENEAKSVEKIDEAVEKLTTDIGDTKVQAINTEATAMEDAAEREILAIDAIVDNLNIIVEKLNAIKGIKLPSFNFNGIKNLKDFFQKNSSSSTALKTILQQFKETDSELAKAYNTYSNLVERSFSFNSKTGETSNLYHNGRNHDTLMDDNSEGKYNSSLHTHPTSYVSMSIYDEKSGKGSGDLAAFYYQWRQGIETQFIRGLKETLVFDAGSFFKDVNISDSSNGEISRQVEVLLKTINETQNQLLKNSTYSFGTLLREKIANCDYQNVASENLLKKRLDEFVVNDDNYLSEMFLKTQELKDSSVSDKAIRSIMEALSQNIDFFEPFYQNIYDTVKNGGKLGDSIKEQLKKASSSIDPSAIGLSNDDFNSILKSIWLDLINEIKTNASGYGEEFFQNMFKESYDIGSRDIFDKGLENAQRDAFNYYLDKYVKNGKTYDDYVKRYSNDSFDKDIWKSFIPSDETENISINMSVLDGLNSLQEILKSINELTNIPNIFNGIKITDKQATALGTLATSLTSIDEALRKIDSNSSESNFLSQITDLTKQADALSNLAKILKESKAKIKETGNAIEANDTAQAVDKENQKFEETTQVATTAAKAKDKFSDANERAASTALITEGNVAGELKQMTELSSVTLDKTSDEYKNLHDWTQMYCADLDEIASITRNIDKNGYITYKVTDINNSSRTLTPQGDFLGAKDIINVSKEYSDFCKILEKIYSIQQKVAKGNINSKDYSDLVQYSKQLEQSQNRINILEQNGLQITELQEDIDRRRESNTSALMEAIKSGYSSIQNILSKLPKDLTSKDVIDNKISQEYYDRYVNLQNLGEQADVLFSTLENKDIISNDDIKNMNDLVSGAKSLSEEMKAIGSGTKSISRDKLIDKISDYMSKNTRMSKEFRLELERIISELNLMGTTADVSDLTDRFLKVKQAVRDAGEEGRTLWDTIKDKAWYGLATQIGTFFGFNDIIRYAKEAVSSIIDLDTALIDLKKTTSMTSSELEDFYYSANDVAKQMGVTTEEIIEQAAAWSRLGYSSNEAATEMATLSSQFASISPGMDTETAQEGLVSIMKAWNISYEDVKSEIMDNINTLGNSFAETNEDIIEGMERSASALSAVGTSYQDAFALFTGAQEILQSSEVAGRALRSISLRVRGYSESSEDGLLEADDELTTITGDLIDLTKTAEHTQGVSIFKDGSTTEFKSLVDYFGEINSIWDEMTEKQQNDYLQKAFGKTQAQAGSALITNYQSIKDSLEAMENSAGSADREMATIEQSIEYKLNALEETWVGTFQDIINRKDIGTAVDLLTKLSEAIGWVLDKIGLLGTIGLGAGAFASLNNVGNTKCGVHKFEICLQ